MQLDRLLAALDPWLDPTPWRFACGEDAADAALMTFREDEGTTSIVEADDDDPDAETFRRITLRVPSSLHAVGLTAAVSGCLAAQGIAANVVAAFHHDHVFVPTRDAERALALLVALARSRAGGDGV